MDFVVLLLQGTALDCAAHMWASLITDVLEPLLTCLQLVAEKEGGFPSNFGRPK